MIAKSGGGIDLNHIQPRHDEINIRLEQWAKWVRVRPQQWFVAPMFRGYISKARLWDIDPYIPVQINTLEAHETEKCVSFLPCKHRDAIRWWYVFPFVHEARVRVELAVTRDGLVSLLDQGRDMVKNRLREKLIETVDNHI